LTTQNPTLNLPKKYLATALVFLTALQITDDTKQSIVNVLNDSPLPRFVTDPMIISQNALPPCAKTQQSGAQSDQDPNLRPKPSDSFRKRP
jgi:hypothetical protein